MEPGSARLTVEVDTGGDTLLQERFTRELFDRLAQIDGVTLSYDGDARAGAGTEPGAKGAALGDTALSIVALAAIARPMSAIVITAIQEWCGTRRGKRVHVTHGSRSVEIVGSPDRSQADLLSEVLDRWDSAVQADGADRAEDLSA